MDSNKQQLNDSERTHAILHAAARIVALSAAVWLVGCSVVGTRESPLRKVTENSPTVTDIYRGRTAADAQTGVNMTVTATTAGRESARDLLRRDSTSRPIAAGDGNSKRYWSALEPMNQRFARVPNPDLVMVVFPHLAHGQYPVPGYVTVFPMYEQTQYALPGEVEEDLLSSRSTR
jgi:conjugative transfer region lipoprotein (TIGR03751 family)